MPLIQAAHWKDLPADAWRWPHFTPEEMACRGDGSLKLDTDFMDRLERLRAAAGFPFRVNSGYRSEAYNATLADSVAHDAHTQGRAVDLAIVGEQAFVLLSLAAKFGFTGIGIKQSGPAGGRFLHLDDTDATPDAPRPWCWSYNA